jgi:hypothetical protein
MDDYKYFSRLQGPGDEGRGYHPDRLICGMTVGRHDSTGTGGERYYREAALLAVDHATIELVWRTNMQNAIDQRATHQLLKRQGLKAHHQQPQATRKPPANKDDGERAYCPEDDDLGQPSPMDLADKLEYEPVVGTSHLQNILGNDPDMGALFKYALITSAEMWENPAPAGSPSVLAYNISRSPSFVEFARLVYSLAQDGKKSLVFCVCQNKSAHSSTLDTVLYTICIGLDT